LPLLSQKDSSEMHINTINFSTQNMVAVGVSARIDFYTLR